jgi:subtilase family serine protease
MMPLLAILGLSLNLLGSGHSSSHGLSTFSAVPPIHIHHHSVSGPAGLTPTQVKAAYQLSGNGSGTIAIVDAYDDPRAQSDLNTFSNTYSLPQCAGTCFTKHEMSAFTFSNSSWALEESLDVEWAHAIAPGAKILLVEAKSSSGNDLINAVNWAKAQPGVVAVSMSWGGSEFAGENSYDADFSKSGVDFFAAAGDSGAGVEWPAVSPNVIGVGGTTLNLKGNTVLSEIAWSGSGGGISAYEPRPSYQTGFVSGSFRGVPDVSYDADPNTGFPVYDSVMYSGYTGWWQVGGTSAGTIQWAAIRALAGSSLTSSKLYSDASSNLSHYFRDIVAGTNGNCNFVCQASTGYDYVTGLGSPITTSF